MAIKNLLILRLKMRVYVFLGYLFVLFAYSEIAMGLSYMEIG